MGPDAYRALATEGPSTSRLGSAFFTLVDPDPGYERAYNRWYEDDHFYSPGAMAIPWWFAGRRWVATRDLRALRAPDRSPIADPVSAGCYLGTYWTSAGHWEDQWAWLTAAAARLHREGRLFERRRHIHTAFYDLRASVRGADSGPRDFQALDYPYSGLVVETVDSYPGNQAMLEKWIREDHAPMVLAKSPASLCLVFVPRPWPAGELWFDSADTPVGRFLVLWFLEEDPRAAWESSFAPEPDRVASSELALTTFLAPFIPTVPGTDRYVDELR